MYFQISFVFANPPHSAAYPNHLVPSSLISASMSHVLCALYSYEAKAIRTSLMVCILQKLRV